MNRDLEAWEWADPADVVERKELQERYQVRKKLDTVREKSRKQAEREILLERLLRKARR